MELAFEKTKALTLYYPRKRDSVRFKIRNTEIKLPSKELKYLGVILDDKKTFGAHITILGKLMPNGVANSMYGAPVWYKTCEIAKHRERLLSTQRKSLLRITCAYHTASTAVPESPIDLLAQERRLLYERSKKEEITTITKQQERRWVLRTSNNGWDVNTIN